MAKTTFAVQKLIDWAGSRLELTPLFQMAAKKTVPVHKHSFWYYMGGIVMILLVEQIVTGLLLMIYYIPELKSAHSSILLINSQVDFGWFIRSLHSWGANLLILFVFIHMFSTFFMKAYRPPREITWMSGLLLLALMFGFGFTGYLLPWDEVSFFATKIGLDIAGKTPFVGELIADILRGGTTIGQNTLSRFFVIHVMVLPLSLLPFIGLHLWLVQAKGMSRPDFLLKKKQAKAVAAPIQPAILSPSAVTAGNSVTGAEEKPEKEKSEKFFPDFLLKDLVAWILILNLLAILVALFPWGLGQEADAFAPAPIGIKPEWYFLAMFQFLKLMPPSIGPIEGEQAGMMLFGGIGLAFLLVPFFDNGQSALRARLATLFGQVVLVGFVAFTIWGWVS